MQGWEKVSFRMWNLIISFRMDWKGQNGKKRFRKHFNNCRKKVLMIYFRKKKSMEREKIRWEKYYKDRISRTWSLSIESTTKKSGIRYDSLMLLPVGIKNLGYWSWYGKGIPIKGRWVFFWMNWPLNFTWWSRERTHQETCQERSVGVRWSCSIYWKRWSGLSKGEWWVIWHCWSE